MISCGNQRTAVLFDPYPLWLDAVAQLLGRIDVQVVDRATTAEAALTFLEECRPDLFVTEIEVTEGTVEGMALLRQTRELVPQLKVIVLSMHSDSRTVELAFEAGASAYVVKSARPEDLAAAVRQSFEHSIYLAGAKPMPVPRLRVVDESPRLTRREVEILQLMAEGLPNAKLAEMLWVTEQTIKFHLSNIYRKLGVANRTEAAHWAAVHGLLKPRVPAVRSA
jgi:two-component system response regulator DevR